MVNIKPKNQPGLKINKVLQQNYVLLGRKKYVSRDTPTSQQSYGSLRAP